MPIDLEVSGSRIPAQVRHFEEFQALALVVFRFGDLDMAILDRLSSLLTRNLDDDRDSS